MPCGCDGRMTVFETVGRGSIPRWGAMEFARQIPVDFARSSNGRTRRSDRRCVGSNPTLVTKLTLFAFVIAKQ